MRNISPSNIFMDELGRLEPMDFSYCMMVNADGTCPETRDTPASV